jgi:hypothetical protein
MRNHKLCSVVLGLISFGATICPVASTAQVLDCKVLLVGNGFREVRDGYPMGSILAKSFSVNVSKNGEVQLIKSSDVPQAPAFDSTLTVIVSPIRLLTQGALQKLIGVQLNLGYSSVATQHKFIASSSQPIVTKLGAGNSMPDYELVSFAGHYEEAGLDGAEISCTQRPINFKKIANPVAGPLGAPIQYVDN